VDYPQLAITGLGLVTPLGLDTGSVWENLKAGRSATTFLEGYRLRGKRCPAARVVPHLVIEGLAGDGDPPSPDYEENPTLWLACLALLQAMRESEESMEGLPSPEKIGLYLGSSVTTSTYLAGKHERYFAGERVPLTVLVHAMNNHLAGTAAGRHGFLGPNRTFSSSCVSALQALDAAACDLDRGVVELAFVLGADSCFHRPLLDSWMNLRALSQLPAAETACRPFCATRAGHALGEAAVCLGLRRSSEGSPTGTSEGFGRLRLLRYSDGYDPDGVFETSEEGMARTMSTCLSDIDPADLAFIHANAGGSREGDVREARAMATSLSGATPAVYASRALVGNTLGVSGLLALVMSLLILKNGHLPADPHILEPDPEITGLIRCQYSPQPLGSRRRVAMVNTFGFGGVVNSLLFEMDP
jgi:3-oxoacyl-[acyl-carrier-protein] synthase II